MKYIIKTPLGYLKLINDKADISFKQNSTEATEFSERNLAQYFANKLVDSKVEKVK